MLWYGGIRAGTDRKRESINEMGEWGRDGGTAVKLEKNRRRKQKSTTTTTKLTKTETGQSRKPHTKWR